MINWRMGGIDWRKAPGGDWYTQPRAFSIECLPNGAYRLYRYGSGLASLHNDLLEAMRAAERNYNN